MTSRFLTALTCAVALAFTACGGDDDDAIDADGVADTAPDDSGEDAEDFDPGPPDFCTLLIENNDAPLSEFPAFAEQIKAVAPPEIADDVAVSIDGFLAYTAVDLTEASADVIEAAEAELAASLDASERVEAWAQENCDSLPPGFFS